MEDACPDLAHQPWNATVHETLSVLVENFGEEAFTAAHPGRQLTVGTHFSLAPTVGTFPVQTGEMVTIPVIFDPASAGLKSDGLTVLLTNDSPSDANPTVSLSGTGSAAVGVAASRVRADGPGLHEVEFQPGRDGSPTPGVSFLGVRFEGVALGTRRFVTVR